MRAHQQRKRLLLSLLLATSWTGSAAAQADQAKGSAELGDGTEAPEDIVVTATKRTEALIDVPAAVTSLKADTLMSAGLNSFKDFAALVPGLQVNNNLGGGVPVIRGLTQGADVGGPTTGIVVDGAPFGISSAYSNGAQDSLDLDPIDLERVEVLRGPQGTLFGANTLGGLISYTLRKPSLDGVEGTARGEISDTRFGDMSGSIRASVSGGLAPGKAGLRVSGYYDRQGGYIDNDLTGATNVNSSRRYGVSASLLLKPSERLTILAAAFQQHVDINGRDVVAYTAGVNAAPRNGQFLYNEYIVPSYKRRTSAGLLTVDYELDWATVTSLTSYQRVKSFQILNGTQSSLARTVSRTLPLYGSPAFPTPAIVSLEFPATNERTTQEFRLTSPSGGRFEWMAGVFYNDEKNKLVTNVNGVRPDLSPIAALAPTLFFDFPTDLKEYSAFANGTVSLTDALDLTLGVRVGSIEQSFRQRFGGSAAAAYNLLLTSVLQALPTPPDTGRVSSKENFATYLATLTYEFSPYATMYARYATGFRPGGPNLVVNGLPRSFESDETRNYEIGLKSNFPGGWGSAELIGYYLDWRNIQVTASAQGLSGYANGGRARNMGFEGAFTLKPVSGLDIAATLAYADATIREARAGVAARGNRLPYTPRWSGSLSMTYTQPLTGDWEGLVSGVARFVGDRHAALAGSTSTPDFLLNNYTLVDARIGLRRREIEIGLFVRNLTDQRSELSAYTRQGFPWVTIARPRTVGMSLAYSF